MPINKKEYYLKDGQLDFSVLDEGKTDEVGQKYGDVLEAIESIKASDCDITETLEEMAAIFEVEDEIEDEVEDEFKKAFSAETLKKELKEFGKMD